MASRSWEKAHSPYWSLHVEAWRQSGMDRAIYCRQHGLSVKTFGRWMIALHRQDLKEVGKAICRFKTASLAFLDKRRRHLRLSEPDRQHILQLGRRRALSLLDVSGYDACKLIEEQGSSRISAKAGFVAWPDMRSDSGDFLLR